MNYISVHEFKSIIDELNIEKGSSCLLHSSIMGLGLIKGIKIKDTPNFIVKELLKKLGKNGTLSVLTPFYDYGLKKKIFNINSSPSSKELGAISKYILKYKNPYRSLNPIFNLSSIGKEANYIAKSISTTAFGYDSSWDRLLNLNTRIVFLGCNMSVCTFIRYIEFRFGVPYLFNKYFQTKIVQNNKIISSHSSSTLRYSYFNLKYDLQNFQNFLKKKRVLKLVNRIKTQAMSIKMKDCFRYGIEKLTDDIFFFLEKKPKFIKNNPPVK